MSPAEPSAAPIRRTTNLPTPVSRFIGREQDIAEVQQRLGRTRLLTLTGPGGIGKTRLALEAARGLQWAYPDGVWLVELAAQNDSALVPEAVATALEVREEPGRPLMDTLRKYLSTRHLLLVLDNCEHLVAACAQLAETVLRAAPQVQVLTTSRETLGIAGERVWPVPSLTLPAVPPTSTSDHLRQFDAIVLFVERARAVQPAFALTDDNAWAVLEICRRLDGIPLAIELAAVWVKTLPVAQLAGRLDDRFRLLTGGSRTALPRQQTLQATIDWSYDLLTQPEQLLFQRLSVFIGGFTLAAAEAVCAGDALRTDDVLYRLAQLIDKSLVMMSEQSGEVRYHLLETLRQYGAEKVQAASDGNRLRRRHRDWFLPLAQQMVAGVLANRVQSSGWRERLEPDADNLAAALAWSDREDAGSETALPLATALASLWLQRGYWIEADRRLTALLAQAGEPTVARANAHLVAGALATAQGNAAKCRAHYAEGLAIFRALRDQSGIAAALMRMGTIATNSSPSEAQGWYEQSLAVCRELDDLHGVARALDGLGELAQLQGDRASARARFEESLTLRRQVNDPLSIAVSLFALGSLAATQGDNARARTLYEESLALHRQLGNVDASAALLAFLGYVAEVEDDYEQARRWHEESLALRQHRGLERAIAQSLFDLGCLELHAGEYARAQVYLEQCLALRKQIENTNGIAWAVSQLGHVARKQGDYRTARACFEESLALFRALDLTSGKCAVTHDMGMLAIDRGDLQTSVALLEEALTLARGMEIPKRLAEALLGLGKAVHRQGDAQRALTLLEESLSLWKKDGSEWGIARAVYYLGTVIYTQGDIERAAMLYREALTLLPRKRASRGDTAACLEGLARVAHATGRQERAARLLGGAYTLREVIGEVVAPADQADWDQLVAAVRSRLSSDGFAVHWAAGRSQSLEQSIAEALEGAATPDIPTKQTPI